MIKIIKTTTSTIIRTVLLLPLLVVDTPMHTKNAINIFIH